LLVNRYFSGKPEIISWRARVLWYAGHDKQAKELVNEALKKDPDNEEYKRIILNMKRSHEWKEEASNLFKAGKIEEAIQKFN
jgi:hypothetical protein